MAFDFGQYVRVAPNELLAVYRAVIVGRFKAGVLVHAGSMPMYQAAHVYFSSTLPPELLAELRSTPGLAAHLATLQEANLEFSVFDCRTFHTNQVWRGCGPACQPEVQRKTVPCKEVVVLALPAVQERALQHLFGRETAGHTDQYQLEVHTAARRVVSLLLSLKVATRDMADWLCTPLPPASSHT